MWGRNIMMGYLNREDKTTEDLIEDGWLKSGDQGFLDEDGYLYITGKLQLLPLFPFLKNVHPVSGAGIRTHGLLIMSLLL